MPRRKKQKKFEEKPRFTYESFGGEFLIYFGTPKCNWRVGEPIPFDKATEVWSWVKEAEKGIQDVLEMIKEGENE